MPKGRAILANLITLAVTLALCLLAAEIGFRLYFGIPLITDRPFYYRINGQGFRGADVPAAKTDSGTCRVALLGDSYVFGMGVREEVTLGRLLEEGMNTPGSRRVEAVNLGTMGWNTRAEADFMLSAGQAYAMDILVLGVTANDVEVEPVLVPYPSLYLLTTNSILLRSVAFGLDRIRKLTGGGMANYDMALKTWYGDKSGPAWRQMQDGMERLAAMARQRKIPMVVLYFEVLAEGEVNGRTLGAEEVGRLARTLDLPFLTLPRVPAGTLGSYQVHVLDTHPNAAAQKLAAATLMKALPDIACQGDKSNRSER